MLALFCLRLAAGMLACLPLLSPRQINPRFYRTQFLVAFGLSAVAAMTLDRATTPLAVWAALGGGLALALAGFFVWSLERAPLGKTLVVTTAIVAAAALGLVDASAGDATPLGWRLAADATSAALLGSATTAMLMGHSYLIAPAMSLTPLLRLLAALAASLALRVALSAVALWLWSDEHALTDLGDVTVLWLPLRWGLGFAAPAVLGWLAYRTAAIRSTQSSTGILYVVVVFCFLGELTGQLLQTNAGFAL